MNHMIASDRHPFPRDSQFTVLKLTTESTLWAHQQSQKQNYLAPMIRRRRIYYTSRLHTAATCSNSLQFTSRFGHLPSIADFIEPLSRRAANRHSQKNDTIVTIACTTTTILCHRPYTSFPRSALRPESSGDSPATTLCNRNAQSCAEYGQSLASRKHAQQCQRQL